MAIERTAKRWKGFRALGSVGALVGVSMMLGGYATASAGGSDALYWWGLVVLMPALMLYAVGRLGGWWFHG